MTEEHHTDSAGDEPVDLVRTQDFDTQRPIELDIGNSAGSIVIEFADTALTRVEVRHDPDAGAFDWREGVAGLLSWVSDRFSEVGVATGTPERPRPGEAQDRGPVASAASAIRQTRIDLTGNRLVVRTPGSAPLRSVPLAIKVRAPEESQLGVRTGSGTVTVTGTAGRVNVQAGTGAVSLDGASGNAAVRSGSGMLRLGAMRGGLHARSGSGDIEVGSISAPSTVASSSGSVWLGEIGGDVMVRTGSGDVTVADAAAGQAELITGSGELQIAVRRGVRAEVDLTSSTGTATSDLSVAEEPPEEEPPLHIFGRTGNGNAMLTSAV